MEVGSASNVILCTAHQQDRDITQRLLRITDTGRRRTHKDEDVSPVFHEAARPWPPTAVSYNSLSIFPCRRRTTSPTSASVTLNNFTGNNNNSNSNDRSLREKLYSKNGTSMKDFIQKNISFPRTHGHEYVFHHYNNVDTYIEDYRRQYTLLSCDPIVTRFHHHSNHMQPQYPQTSFFPNGVLSNGFSPSSAVQSQQLIVQQSVPIRVALEPPPSLGNKLRLPSCSPTSTDLCSQLPPKPPTIEAPRVNGESLGASKHQSTNFLHTQFIERAKWEHKQQVLMNQQNKECGQEEDVEKTHEFGRMTDTPLDEDLPSAPPNSTRSVLSTQELTQQIESKLRRAEESARKSNLRSSLDRISARTSGMHSNVAGDGSPETMNIPSARDSGRKSSPWRKSVVSNLASRPTTCSPSILMGRVINLTYPTQPSTASISTASSPTNLQQPQGMTAFSRYHSSSRRAYSGSQLASSSMLSQATSAAASRRMATLEIKPNEIMNPLLERGLACSKIVPAARRTFNS